MRRSERDGHAAQALDIWRHGSTDQIVTCCLLAARSVAQGILTFRPRADFPRGDNRLWRLQEHSSWADEGLLQFLLSMSSTIAE
jgi:hypothetical protein